jgi:hypothetical protein
VAAETFENGGSSFGPDAEGISFVIEADPDKARFGLKSGRISYSFGEKDAGRRLPANVALTSGLSWLSLWVSGDNSGNRLELDVTRSSGAVTALTVCTLDFTGYKQFHLQLPSGASKVSALRVVKTETGALKGSILTDQWVASPQRADTTREPLTTLDVVSIDGSAVTVEGSALDANRLPLAASGVTLTWDGAPQTIAYSTITGRFTLTIPLTDELRHRLTLEAVDPSGARSRVSYDVNAGEGTAVFLFDDVSDNHWAADFIGYLSARGVLTATGSSSSFNPDRALTRADMAVWIARFLRLDLSKYDSAALPFTDLNSIPSGALREIRALYALGVVKGKAILGEKQYYDPAAPITRAEFCALLGRTQPRGHRSAALGFADAGHIPAYAVPHIQTMIALGVIEGYPDNTMRSGGNITRAEAAKILYMFY